MTQPTGDPDWMDTAYSLLGESQRRYLLYLLTDNSHGNIDELSLQIAAWEHDESISSVSEDMRQQIYIGLVHNHLPRLADHGIVDYDLRSGDIVLEPGFEDLEPLLEQFKRTEDVPEERLSSPPIAE